MSASFFEQPILNSPYEAPRFHHALDDYGQPLDVPPVVNLWDRQRHRHQKRGPKGFAAVRREGNVKEMSGDCDRRRTFVDDAGATRQH